MTADRIETLREEAICWHVRIADGSADDWEAFVVWLGADPAHAEAYDAIEAVDAEAGPAILEAQPPRPQAANDDSPNPSRGWGAGWRPWLGSPPSSARAWSSVVIPIR